MAGQNDFLVFDENNSNILTQEMYEDDADRQNGFKRGLARSNVNNKVLRQTSMMATAIGEYIKDNDENASDGNLEQLKTAFKNSVVSPKLNQTITGSMTFAQPISGSITSANSAVRDGDGNVITETYARYTDYPTHALKAFKDEGEPLTDKEALDDIIGYKYSSFCGVNDSGEDNPKKFNKVGNPIIKDGIASNFSVDDYLTVNLNNGVAQKIIIKSKSVFGADNNDRLFNFIKGTAQLRVQVYATNTNKHLECYLTNSQGTNKTLINDKMTGTINEGDIIETYIEISANQQTLKLTVNGVDYIKELNVELDSSYLDFLGLILIGKFYVGDSYCDGSIDLKQFSITVDGEEVFTGRKTGIDILKSNDFSTITKIFAYKYSTYTVYADKNASPTTLYNDDGSYYTGTDFIILNNTVGYPVNATYSPSDNITVGGATLYAFKSGNSIIYADASTNPTTLLNADGTTYSGSTWMIKSGVVKYINTATYTSGSNITLTLPSQSNPNYTVDASVKISADGVASGFSTSNYITKSNALTIGSDGEFHIDFNCNSTSSSDWQYIIDVCETWGNELTVRRVANGNVYYFLVFAGGSVLVNDVLISSNPKVSGYVEYKNGAYTIKLDGDPLTKTITASKMTATTYDVALGCRIGNIGGTPIHPLTNGSIDLNGIRLINSLGLVYQPLLRIPYTESSSKFGSKIVNSIYRNRVQDAYEQGYLQRYYTLDEENENFTLPMGELYGMIEQRVKKQDLKEIICIIEEYAFSDANAFCWDLSNGWRIQGARQTVASSGTMTVPLLKPFTTDQYLAFKNYGAGVGTALADNEGSIFGKTTTSFQTQNLTGDTNVFDWIAIGR